MRRLFHPASVDFLKSLFARGVGAPLTLVANVLLARALGVEQYGEYLTLFSAALVAGSIAAFGVAPVITREIAAEPVNNRRATAHAIMHWANALTSKYGILATVVLLLWLAVGPGAPPSTRTDRLLAIAIVFPSIWIAIFPGGLAGLLQVAKSQAVGNGLKNLFLLGGALLIAALPSPTPADALALQLVATTVSAFIGYLWFLQYARELPSAPSMTAVRGMIAQHHQAWWQSSAHFFSMSLATTILFRLDVVIVGAFSNTTEAGVFGVAARLAQIAQVIGLVWLYWLRPRVAAAVLRSSPQQLRESLRTATIAVTSMAGTITIIAWIATSSIVRIFGQGFEGAIWPFRLLMLGNLAWCISVPGYTLLTMSGSERIVSRVIWLQMIVTISLSIPLCRAFGALGAASAWLVGAILSAILVTLLTVNRHYPRASVPSNPL